MGPDTKKSAADTWLSDFAETGQPHSAPAGIAGAPPPGSSASQSSRAGDPLKEWVESKNPVPPPPLQDLNAPQKRARARGIVETDRTVAPPKEEPRPTIKENIENVTENISTTMGGISDRAGAIRTVGGIGLLLAIIVLLLFIVVRVNSSGDTRLKQLWYMIAGRASLVGRVKPTTVIAPPTTATGTPAPPTNVPSSTPSSNLLSGTTSSPGLTSNPAVTGAAPHGGPSINGTYRTYTSL